MRSQQRALEQLRRSAVDGTFTVEMARAAGFSRGAIRHRREYGVWRHVVGKAYCDPGWAGRSSEPWRRLVGASLSWRGGVLCLRSAALGHGFRVADDGMAHVAVPDARRCVGGLVPHRLILGAADVRREGVVLLTARERTAVDCLMTFPRREAEGLMAWLLSRDVVSRTALAAAAEDRKGHRGVVQLRALLALTVDGALSQLERELHRVLREAGISGWLANEPVRAHGRIIARADVLFPALKVILEADGKAYHQDFEADRQRLNALTLAGYVVLRFTWRQVTEEPGEVLRQVRQALAAADRR